MLPICCCCCRQLNGGMENRVPLRWAMKWRTQNYAERGEKKDTKNEIGGYQMWQSNTKMPAPWERGLCLRLKRREEDDLTCWWEKWREFGNGTFIEGVPLPLLCALHFPLYQLPCLYCQSHKSLFSPNSVNNSSRWFFLPPTERCT